MKSLKEFIEEQIYIEYKFSIYEKNYKYNGQDELAKFITKFLYKFVKKYPNKLEISLSKNVFEHYNIKNIFFDKLTLILKTNVDANGSFIANKSNFINDKLDNIVIQINKDICKINNKELVITLMHELSHAYHHYSAYLHGTQLVTSLSDSASSYRKTLLRNNDNLDFGTKLAKTILNRLFKFEQSAYLSELYVSIDYEKCDNEDDVLNAIRMTDTWKEFNQLHAGIELIGNLDNSEKENFVQTYNNIKNVNWKFIKIKKKLLERLDYFINKIEKISIKIFKDFYENIDNQINESKYSSKLTIDMINWFKECNEFDLEKIMIFITEYA